MKGLLSLVLSSAIHLSLIFLVIFLFEYTKGDKVLVTLDLSSIEFSLSEKESSEDVFSEEVSSATNEEVVNVPMSDEPSPQVEEILATEPLVVIESSVEILAGEEPHVKMTNFSPNVEKVSEAKVQAQVTAKPSPKKTIRPKYPLESRRRREEGSVRLSFLVGVDGFSSEIKILQSSGYKLLDEEAVKAIKAAKFNPARQGDRPISHPAEITLKFQLKF